MTLFLNRTLIIKSHAAHCRLRLVRMCRAALASASRKSRLRAYTPHTGVDAAADADVGGDTEGAEPAEDAGAGAGGSTGVNTSRFREGL